MCALSILDSHSVGSQYDVRFYSKIESEYLCAKCQIVAAGSVVVDVGRTQRKKTECQEKPAVPRR